MAEYLVQGESITAVADAIREKGGTTAPLSFPAGMAKAVRGIPSGGTDISLGLTAATVGQTVKVKAVDTDGKPTAWEAVDAAWGEKPIEKIIDTEITEKTGIFEVNNLQGVSAIVAIWSGIFSESNVDSGLNLEINDVQVANFGFIKVSKKDTLLYGYSIAELVNGFWVCDISPGAISPNNVLIGTNFKKPYNLVADVGAANKISFTSPVAHNPISGRLEVWAR